MAVNIKTIDKYLKSTTTKGVNVSVTKPTGKNMSAVNALYVSDTRLFHKVLNFVLELDTDAMDETQLAVMSDIIGSLELDDMDYVSEARLAKKSSITKRRRQRQYYRKNKAKIKKRKKLLARSMEGKKRERMKKRNAKRNLTATGRRIVSYRR